MPAMICFVLKLRIDFCSYFIDQMQLHGTATYGTRKYDPIRSLGDSALYTGVITNTAL